MLTNLIWQHMRRKTQEAECQFTALGAIIIAGYIGFYILWHNVNVQQYENLTLRLIASLIGLTLITRQYLPKKLNSLLPLYWYAAMAYLFPFFFTFMLLMNDASAIWQVNSMVGLTLLVILADWVSSVILTAIGASIAWIVYNLITPNPQIPYSVIHGVLYDYIVIIAFGGLFIHNKEMHQLEKLKTLTAFGGMIAHEMRTPLAALRLSGIAIKKTLPSLLSTYKIAQEHQLETSRIDKRTRDSLPEIVNSIEIEAVQALRVVDMILMNIDPTKVEMAELSTQHLAATVYEALERYAFNREETNLVSFNNQVDFEFRGNDLFIHVMFNLLKNALYQIKATGKGHIEIWAELGPEFNSLHFKDTAKGLSKSELSQLFNRFYSNTQHGSGLGLAFCKMVMQSYGGDITCHAKEGQFAEFVLKFPVISKD